MSVVVDVALQILVRLCAIYSGALIYTDNHRSRNAGYNVERSPKRVRAHYTAPRIRRLRTVTCRQSSLKRPSWYIRSVLLINNYVRVGRALFHNSVGDVLARKNEIHTACRDENSLTLCDSVNLVRDNSLHSSLNSWSARLQTINIYLNVVTFSK